MMSYVNRMYNIDINKFLLFVSMKIAKESVQIANLLRITSAEYLPSCKFCMIVLAAMKRASSQFVFVFEEISIYWHIAPLLLATKSDC